MIVETSETNMFNWKGLFRSHILERGWNYAYDGSVTGLVRTADSISAVVQGNEYYKVKIMYSGNKITDGYCSCPYAHKETGKFLDGRM